MKDNKWLQLLAYVTGMVNQQLLLQNEYLASENRILRAHLPRRLRLSDAERSTLAEIGKRLGRKALSQIACVAKSDTILAWYRRLIAQKFDGSKNRSYPGRPPIKNEIVQLIVKLARENSGWGYDRIVGALANLGHVVSDQTVGNILRFHGTAPGPRRSQNTTWKDFVARHIGPNGRSRFLHCGGADVARFEDLLCAVLSAPRNASGEPGWHNAASDGGMDGADSPQRGG